MPEPSDMECTCDWMEDIGSSDVGGLIFFGMNCKCKQKGSDTEIKLNDMSIITKQEYAEEER